MKTFRLIGMAMMAVLMSFSLVSCSSDDDDNDNGSKTNSLLVGTWKCTNQNYTDIGLTVYSQFTSDGKYYEVDIDEEENEVDILYGNWTLEDDKLIITGGNTIGYFEVTIVELSKNSLTLSTIYTLYFEKVDDSEIAPYLSGEYDVTDQTEKTDDDVTDQTDETDDQTDQTDTYYNYKSSLLEIDVVIPEGATESIDKDEYYENVIKEIARVLAVELEETIRGNYQYIAFDVVASTTADEKVKDACEKAEASVNAKYEYAVGSITIVNVTTDETIYTIKIKGSSVSTE